MIENTHACQLTNIFDDATYAWSLLEAQISIEMTPIVSGQSIAKLLELYMKGVQKMNSVSDERQSYFKNKVTSLMTKNTVIKSLKQNPMKKKSKHQQAHCKQQMTGKKQMAGKKQKDLEPVVLQKTIKISHLELKQKQRQFQMRVAYTAHQSNPDALRKLMLQQECRQENISKKISNIINNHEERLKQRIKARKLRTATYKAESQFNQESQTQPSTNKFKSNRKEELYFQPIDGSKQQQKQTAHLLGKGSKSYLKRYKSLQNLLLKDQLVRKRKYTIDLV